MKIAMIGTGYVGLVSGVCFSDFGHDIVCVDKDPRKIEMLERGEVPLDESIRLYQRGSDLRKRCEDKLKEAEEKVAAITLDAKGEPSGVTPVEGL